MDIIKGIPNPLDKIQGNYIIMDEAVKEKNRANTAVAQPKKVIKPFFNQKVTGVKNSQHERQLKKHNKLIDRQKNRTMRLISDDTNNLRHEFKLIQLSKQKNDLELRKRDNPIEDYSLHEAGIATSERFLRNTAHSYYLDKTNPHRRRSIPDPKHVTPLIARARESLRNIERIQRKTECDILTVAEEQMRSDSRRGRSQSLIESLDYSRENSSTVVSPRDSRPKLMRNFTEGNIISTDIFPLSDDNELEINKSRSNPNLHFNNELFSHEKKSVSFDLQVKNECVKPKTAGNRTKQQISPTLRLSSGQRFPKPSQTDDFIDTSLFNRLTGINTRQSVGSTGGGIVATKDQFNEEKDSLKERIDHFLSGLNNKTNSGIHTEKSSINNQNGDMSYPRSQTYFHPSDAESSMNSRWSSFDASKTTNGKAHSPNHTLSEEKVSKWRFLAEKVQDNIVETLTKYPAKIQNGNTTREGEPSSQRRRSSVAGIPQHSMQRAKRHTATSKLRKIVDDLMKQKTRYELNELEEVRQRMKEEERKNSELADGLMED